MSRFLSEANSDDNRQERGNLPSNDIDAILRPDGAAPIGNAGAGRRTSTGPTRRNTVENPGRPPIPIAAQRYVHPGNSFCFDSFFCLNHDGFSSAGYVCFCFNFLNVIAYVTFFLGGIFYVCFFSIFLNVIM